jgi:hypothetical protein
MEYSKKIARKYYLRLVKSAVGDDRESYQYYDPKTHEHPRASEMMEIINNMDAPPHLKQQLFKLSPEEFFSRIEEMSRIFEKEHQEEIAQQEVQEEVTEKKRRVVPTVTESEPIQKEVPVVPVPVGAVPGMGLEMIPGQTLQPSVSFLSDEEIEKERFRAGLQLYIISGLTMSDEVKEKLTTSSYKDFRKLMKALSDMNPDIARAFRQLTNEYKTKYKKETQPKKREERKRVEVDSDVVKRYVRKREEQEWQQPVYEPKQVGSKDLLVSYLSKHNPKGLEWGKSKITGWGPVVMVLLDNKFAGFMIKTYGPRGDVPPPTTEEEFEKEIPKEELYSTVIKPEEYKQLLEDAKTTPITVQRRKEIEKLRNTLLIDLLKETEKERASVVKRPMPFSFDRRIDQVDASMSDVMEFSKENRQDVLKLLDDADTIGGALDAAYSLYIEKQIAPEGTLKDMPELVATQDGLLFYWDTSSSRPAYNRLKYLDEINITGKELNEFFDSGMEDSADPSGYNRYSGTRIFDRLKEVGAI